mgnify:CR=1 FL=1
MTIPFDDIIRGDVALTVDHVNEYFTSIGLWLVGSHLKAISADGELRLDATGGSRIFYCMLKGFPCTHIFRENIIRESPDMTVNCLNAICAKYNNQIIVGSDCLVMRYSR